MSRRTDLMLRSLPPITDVDSPVAAAADVDRSFRLMGTHMRVLVGAASPSGPRTPEQAADVVVALLENYDERLSRFLPGSELCALNADARETVPASDLLRDAVRVALHAAQISGGLVDPTILDALEAAGYRDSWDSARRLDLDEALAGAGVPRHPAAPRSDATWQAITIDDGAGTITRPAGVRIDTGGTGKGHAADLAAELLSGFDTWAVDCGGDLRLGGTAGAVRDVELEHPFTGERCETVRMRDGAIATSGLRSRIWRGADGRVAHHLLDPATGEPAFTGLVAATALAPTAVEAEARAKTALLRGPDGARLVLAPHGGITIDEQGRVERIGRLEPPPRIRFRMTDTRSAA